jgi:hypothetical protein
MSCFFTVGDTILRITFPQTTDLADYEWFEECKDPRERCVPAHLINSEATVTLDFDDGSWPVIRQPLRRGSISHRTLSCGWRDALFRRRLAPRLAGPKTYARRDPPGGQSKGFKRFKRSKTGVNCRFRRFSRGSKTVTAVFARFFSGGSKTFFYVFRGSQRVPRTTLTPWTS